MSLASRKKLVLAVTSASALFFGGILYLSLFYAPSGEVALPDKEDASSAVVRPVRLIVPRLQVDAEIQEVGVTASGHMATPNNYTDVGWYKYGTLPGEVGSAVLAGHVNNGLDMAGVFFRLSEIAPGDLVQVKREDGQVLEFVVTKIEEYGYYERNTDVFTDNSGKLIKLVTCTGTWLSNVRTHDKRLVVTAALAE